MNKGFSLIETIVAISVILIGIVGLYTLVPFYLNVIAVNSDKFVAAQLAREGIELIRNIRDNNLLAGGDWKAGLEGCTVGCQMDYNDAYLVGYNDTMPLRLNNITGFYNYDPITADNVATKYRRKITITSSDPSRYLTVDVEIRGLLGNNTFKAIEKIYNWR